MVDKFRETITQFEARIEQARYSGDDWVETCPEIIDYFNKKGLGGAKYFIYKGIKVCEVGKVQEILDEENYPLQKRIHGESEALMDGR